MEKRSILHMLDPMPYNSPFDINMAMDAGFEVLMPYSNVKLDSVYRLTQDVIFSRSPAGVKRTGIFIGGRDLSLALDMLATCKQAMVPPFEVSVFADPSGAFTTAAALVACVEKQLRLCHHQELKDCKALVFGGTGPVGIATGLLAAREGAHTTLVDHLSLDAAMDVAHAYGRRFSCTLHAAVASSDEDKAKLIAEADIIFSVAKAGIQVLKASVLQKAKYLKVAGDVNAVPPLGVEGIKRSHLGVELVHATQAAGAVGIGALAVGNVKYQLQNEMLQLMLTTDKPLYLDFQEAFNKARLLV